MSCSKSNPQESIWKTIQWNTLALILIYVGLKPLFFVIVVSNIINKYSFVLYSNKFLSFFDGSLSRTLIQVPYKVFSLWY